MTHNSKQSLDSLTKLPSRLLDKPTSGNPNNNIGQSSYAQIILLADNNHNMQQIIPAPVVQSP